MLGWSAKVSLSEGLRRTVRWAAREGTDADIVAAY